MKNIHDICVIENIVYKPPILLIERIWYNKRIEIKRLQFTLLLIEIESAKKNKESEQLYNLHIDRYRYLFPAYRNEHSRFSQFLLMANPFNDYWSNPFNP